MTSSYGRCSNEQQSVQLQQTKTSMKRASRTIIHTLYQWLICQCFLPREQHSLVENELLPGITRVQVSQIFITGWTVFNEHASEITISEGKGSWVSVLVLLTTLVIYNPSLQQRNMNQFLKKNLCYIIQPSKNIDRTPYLRLGPKKFYTVSTINYSTPWLVQHRRLGEPAFHNNKK